MHGGGMTTATLRNWLDLAPYGDDYEWVWLPRCDYPSVDDVYTQLWGTWAAGHFWDYEETERVRLGWVVIVPFRDEDACHLDWDWLYATEVPRGAPYAIEGWVVESW